MSQKVVFITGASSGIGRETAKLFQANGWQVVATMRNPAIEQELTTLDQVLVTRLDVTDSASIDAAVGEAIARFGKIDVLVNNAGYGAYGLLEAFDMEGIRRQFNTNVIGLLEVTKAVLPHMRAKQSGIVVNISSIGGKMTFPLGTLYHGTKFAVEGLSEALHYELGPIGIRVKIIEPGMVETDFNGRSFDFRNDVALAEYQPTVEMLGAVFQGIINAGGAKPSVVSEVIWDAVNDGSNQLRYTAGVDAAKYMANRKTLDDETFIGGLAAYFGL